MTDLPASLPVHLPQATPARVLATGAFLKNRACLIEGEHVLWSSEHGDLGDAQACLALETSVGKLCNETKGSPVALAHDLHPDFYSTRVATRTAAAMGITATAVQHHHAHIAATIAQRGITCPVIGIALDGFGLGSDNSAWGGELLRVDGGCMAHRWNRLAHLHPLRLPGGDRATNEPWRLVAALLHDVGRSAEIEQRFTPRVGQQAAGIIKRMLVRNLNCPRSTSAGRWFDLAAAALGLCTDQNREGEAAEALERCAIRYLQRWPDFKNHFIAGEHREPENGATHYVRDGRFDCRLDLRDIVITFLDVDQDDSLAIDRCAAVFHLALANAMASAATIAARHSQIDNVVLGGGCLVNQILRQQITDQLQQAGLRVHLPAASICGDTALALGQAWVAACSQEIH